MPKKVNSSNLKGLGGWLIIFQIGLIINILWHFFLGLSLYFEPEHLLRGFIFGASLLLLSFYEGYTLFLLYMKDYRFPIIATLGLWLPFAGYLLVLLFSFLGYENMGSASGEEIVKGALYLTLPAIIWTFYLKESKRVKNTFVKRKN